MATITMIIIKIIITIIRQESVALLNRRGRGCLHRWEKGQYWDPISKNYVDLLVHPPQKNMPNDFAKFVALAKMMLLALIY